MPVTGNVIFFFQVFRFFKLEEIPFLKNGFSEYNVTDYVGWSSFCLTLSLHEDLVLDWLTLLNF